MYVNRWVIGIGLIAAAGCTWYEPLTLDDAAYLEKLHRQAVQERVRAGHEMQRRPTVVKPLLPAEDPKAERWLLSLQKCVEVAIANNPNLQVVRLNPAIEETRVQNAAAAFDAIWRASAQLSRTEEISTSAVSTGDFESLFADPTGGGAGASEQREAVVNKAMLYRTELEKRLPTGGLFNISTGLQRIRSTNLIVSPNPYYASDVTLSVSHPLLRGAGVEVNRAGIRISRLNKHVAVERFRAELMSLLQKVEQGYWRLWFAYEDLKSRRTALQRAGETLKKVELRLQAGASSVPDVEQARQQYLQFKAEVLQGLERLHRADLQLRRLLGVVLDDRRMIQPSDEPSTAKLVPNWHEVVRQAMGHRPEVSQQRLAMASRQVALRAAKNSLLPKLDLQLLWRINGLGATTSDSYGVLTNNDFNDGELGLQFEWPIGNRSARADARRARLEFVQAMMQLRDVEQQVKQDVLDAFRSVSTTHAFIPIRREQLAASRKRLAAARVFYEQGRTTTDQLLEAEEEVATAERNLAAAVVNYNVALVNLELAKGTLLQYNNVVLEESAEDF